MKLNYPIKHKEHPGYLGKKRDEVYKCWDEQYGKDKWIIVYELGELDSISDFIVN
jgi:hypothetical protein